MVRPAINFFKRSEAYADLRKNNTVLLDNTVRQKVKIEDKLRVANRSANGIENEFLSAI